MILIDTHIWVWWVNREPKLSQEHKQYLEQNHQHGIGVSIFSCWEIAKLVEAKRLGLKLPILAWITNASSMPGVQLIPLSPEIVVASTQLPGTFHKDPADQIIVATARTYRCPLMTVDSKILDYPHVTTL